MGQETAGQGVPFADLVKCLEDISLGVEASDSLPKASELLAHGSLWFVLH